jgi:hypothetical protein
MHSQKIKRLGYICAAAVVLGLVAYCIRGRSGSASSIDQGFVFIDGEYVGPPYVAEIRDERLLLNGRVVGRVSRRTEGFTYDGTDDPGVPAWIDSKTSLGTLAGASRERPGVAFQKWAYLVSKHPPKEAIREMVKYLEQMPCVAGVEVDGPIRDEYCACLIVKSPQGDKFALFLEPPQKALVTPAGGQSNAEGLLSQKNAIMTLLSHNAALFFFGEHMSISMNPVRAARQLPALLSIIESNVSQQDKADAAKALGIQVRADAFVKGYRHSDELVRRLKELANKTGIVSMTLEEAKKEALQKALEGECLSTCPSSKPATGPANGVLGTQHSSD